jgi:dienelactone hydrolase
MRIIIAILFTAICLGAEPLPNLQRPPSPRPGDLPKLSPLTANATGQAITKPSDWTIRREELRRDWTKLLGVFPAAKAPLAPEFFAREELPTFTRQRVSYQIEDGVRTDAMLLTPKSAEGKFPGIVLFHPTYSNHYARVAGLEGKEEPERHQAVQLVERGYVVLAPRCFIYSELPPGYQKKAESIYVANVRRLRERHPAWRGLTRMTWDGIRALDFIETLPNVNGQRLGIFGHSLGAKEAIYVAAFDERVKCTVSSEGGVGLSFSNWQDVWYLSPEIRQSGFARDHHELLALIAPRPFLLLAGNSADTDKSWAYIEAVLPVYELLGGPQNPCWFNHGLGHRYGGAARPVAEAFLDCHLKH